jgi:DNA-binding HxlR family transcriptional regulator
MKEEILEKENAAVGDCEAPLEAQHYFRAFTILQEKWVLFILFILMRNGAHGFNEIIRKAGGVINTTTLSQRLSLLEQAGLIKRTVHSTLPPRTSYELTAAGYALEPIFQAVGKWSEENLADQLIECAISGNPKGKT